ncbi:MAG: hypothetical protein FWC27_08070 [Firmicutes bacterium]|nr:hypothetical protein [Bacillota bacterium]
MKSYTKLRKALCLLLAIAMFCAVLPVGAQAAGCNCKDIPRIGLPGIGDTLLLNAGTPEETGVGVVDTDALVDEILPILGDISGAVALRSWDKAADAFIKLAWGMLGHMQVDEKGKSVQPITAKPCDDPKTRNHKEKQSFNFKYDWRMDPWAVAAELNAYIKQVKKATGHSQVALLAHSEGNLICMAYFARYGYGDVHDYIASMSAHNGLTLVGELFNRNVELGCALLLELLRSFGAASGEGAMELMGPAADLLQTTGIAEQLVKLLAILLEHVQDRVFDEALIPLVVQWPALWGFVPHEYYESAKAKLLGGAKYAAFRKMIDNMHYKAGAGYKADTLIKNAVKAGVRVSIIAGYGFPTMPFAPNSDIDADGLVDTKRASSGAATPGLFNTFPAGYKQKKNDGHNHLSPDGKIDASTCLLPEQTWFIRGQLHFSGNTGALREAILSTPGKPTVRNVKGYPQFLSAVSDGVFVPNEPVPAAAKPTLLGSAWGFNKTLGKVIWESIAG